jgi:segregation and condensation protein B
MENAEIKSLLEALLFTSSEPISLEHLQSVVPDSDQEALTVLLQEMSGEYESRQSGLVMRQVAGGYQLVSNPRWHSQIQTLFSKPLVIKLSRSALETLAIVAYKQPITLPEISDIRSCNAAGAIKTLLECNFIKVLGRRRVVGRPFLYGTAREFLIHFGLKDLSDLPQLQEFEELIGEKLSPEIFHAESQHTEMDLETPDSQIEQSEPAAAPEAEETELVEE